MKNELRFFSYEQLGEVCPMLVADRDAHPGRGVVYFIEINERVKIGCSGDPASRIKVVIANALKYSNATIGKIAVSQFHEGYRIAERNTHVEFSEFRVKGTELFEVDFFKATSFFEKTEEIALSTQNAPLTEAQKTTPGCIASKSINIRNAIQTLQEIFPDSQYYDSIVEYAQEITDILSSPVCWYCASMAPTSVNECVFLSYDEIIQVLGKHKIMSCYDIIGPLMSHINDFSSKFSILIQFNVFGRDGSCGINLLCSGLFKNDFYRFMEKFLAVFVLE